MEKWITAIKPNEGDIFNLDNLSQFITHEGQHHSHPTIYKYNNTNYIFYVSYINGKSIIKCCSISEDMEISSSINVLNLPYSVSSPNLFEHNGETYMLPEVSNNGIEIYRTSDFPYRWELYRRININAKIHSPTIFYHKDIWFLLGTVQTYQTTDYETEGVQGIGTSADDGLIIFYSSDFNQWSLHPECKNGYVYYPESRNAGKIFNLGGKLIKPVQQTNPIKPESGYSIGFKEVKITTEFYTETLLDNNILPDWGSNIERTHTFNFNEDFIVIDGAIKSPTYNDHIFKGKDQMFVNYWFPRNKNYKTKLSIEKRLENIKILTSTLQKYNISSGLAFGTLLGAFRDKSLIPHDHDDDLYAFKKDKNLFTKEVFLDLKKQGMRVMRVVDNDRTISFYRDGYYIDLLFVDKNEKGNYHFWLSNKEVEVANHHFEKFNTITLSNGIYNILNNTEEFLEKTYGDWKTPVMTHGRVNGKYADIN